ncbi:MAG: hypothetical protein HOV87_14335 [Catenulispora sp.]|nr:hypothetical protein [Catenulispora sp.]
MQHKRGISGFAAVAVVALAGTACSSSGTTGATGGTTGSDPAAAGAHTEALTVLAKMPAPQAVAQTTKTVSAKKSVKVHMTMKSPTLNETADGSMSYGGAAKADLTMSMSSDSPQVGPLFEQMGQMEMRMDGTVAWLNMGHSAQMKAALQGKAWVKMDFAQIAGDPQLKSFSFLKDVLKNNDPGAQLHALLASPDLKLAGTEPHGGVQTLHYAGDLSADDLTKMVAGATLTQDDVNAIKDTLQQAGVTKASYDVWIDGDGLPVAVKFSEDTKVGTVSGDLTYRDWGAPVTVTAPPADQTADILSLLNGQ